MLWKLNALPEWIGECLDGVELAAGATAYAFELPYSDRVLIGWFLVLPAEAEVPDDLPLLELLWYEGNGRRRRLGRDDCGFRGYRLNRVALVVTSYPRIADLFECGLPDRLRDSLLALALEFCLEGVRRQRREGASIARDDEPELQATQQYRDVWAFVRQAFLSGPGSVKQFMPHLIEREVSTRRLVESLLEAETEGSVRVNSATWRHALQILLQLEAGALDAAGLETPGPWRPGVPAALAPAIVLPVPRLVHAPSAKRLAPVLQQERDLELVAWVAANIAPLWGLAYGAGAQYSGDVHPLNMVSNSVKLIEMATPSAPCNLNDATIPHAFRRAADAIGRLGSELRDDLNSRHEWPLEVVLRAHVRAMIGDVEAWMGLLPLERESMAASYLPVWAAGPAVPESPPLWIANLGHPEGLRYALEILRRELNLPANHKVLDEGRRAAFLV